MISRLQRWLAARRRSGPSGERVAARFLKRRGYRILARNVRNRYGEIDLIAQPRDDRNVLVFVEVKAGTAGSDLPPEVHVTALKQRKITALSAQVLRAQRMTALRVRYDVIAVEFVSDSPKAPPVIRHHIAAFESRV
ncbi:MAG: YraN family protein [Phycisphaeraceae bacterium]|nr:YraN family protein [Phycisphaeraceae bacterium]